MKYKYLGKVNNSIDVKMLSEDAVPLLCDEIRNELIYRVEENGGHLASNLGVVELTVALHRVFDFPDDKLVFDVGHQSYVHKMITGRYGRFDTLRTPGGITGFENRSESEYDFFGTGHAGTSLSAALGFAQAEKIRGGKRFAVAVVGDGAYTCGMIQEALNNCMPDLRLVIILNENEMSISRNIGGFAKYMAKVRSSKGYYGFKGRTRNFVAGIPFIGKSLALYLSKKKQKLKNRLFRSNLFEDMGIFYLGPCDGNDYTVVERLLRQAKSLGKCCILHVKTIKGKGYAPAEENPAKYHGLSPKSHKSDDDGDFSLHFGRRMCEEAEKDSRIVAITAAMADGTGLIGFRQKFPDRFFDVGIAEEHGATFASGLCAAGMKPVFAVYSTFFQRTFDSVVHDIALQKLPVVFCLDRAGLSECDGPTHHGLFDVSMVMSVPDTVLYAPLDFSGFDKAFDEAMSETRPAFIRYKSGSETKVEGFTERFDFIRTNFTGQKKNLIITYGRVSLEAIKAYNGGKTDKENTGIVILEKLKGDSSLSDKLASLATSGEGKIIFLEEGVRTGGAGMSIGYEICRMKKFSDKTFSCLAIDSFGKATAGEDIFFSCGISAEDIEREMNANNT